MNNNNTNITDIAVSILNNTNNDYKWLYVKLPDILRIEEIDKDNNYFVKPNDCRWWFGDNKTIRYKKLCRIVKKNGYRTFSRKVLEEVVKIRLNYNLFIPNHPIPGFSFEKDIFSGGRYFLCKNGIIVKKKSIFDDKISDECPICYTQFNNNNFIITNCNHKFCVNCIFKHYQTDNGHKCPLCRKEFVEKRQTKRRNIIVDSDDEEIILDSNATFITQNIESIEDTTDNNINRNLVYEFNNTFNNTNDISANYINMYNNNQYIMEESNIVNDWYFENDFNRSSTFEPALSVNGVLSGWLSNFNN